MRYLLFLFTLTLLVSCETKELPPPPEVVAEVSSFTLKDYAKKDIRFAPGDKKGPAIINFWATWCIPCIEELPLLERLYLSKKGEGLRVIAVNVEEKPDVVKAFWEKHGYSIAAPIDVDSEVTHRFEVFGLPTTFFVDAKGKVRLKHMGLLTREILYDGLEKIMP